MPPAGSPPPTTLLQFVPLLLITVPLLVVLCLLARRKGRSVALAFVLGLVPFVNFLSAIWLASLTDQSVRDELEALRRSARG